MIIQRQAGQKYCEKTEVRELGAAGRKVRRFAKNRKPKSTLSKVERACSVPVKTKPLIDVANYNFNKGKKTPHTVRAKEKRTCGCRELI
ncbi:hypothetical protein A6B43_00375 [Vespertiliibacter pulmonis]|nr:hypothetical protein A6B43_00025 [Vespertiliibacter pulmonis]QLB21600.1 hypothetical protein A6B43_00375 [Vespertiliibacter pulmonis]